MPSKLNLADFRPLDSHVLLEPDFAKAAAANLIVPDSVKKEGLSPFGTVVAVGPGRQLENGQRQEMGLMPGDRVMISAWRGQGVEVRGRALLLIQRDAIVGVIEDLPEAGFDLGGKNATTQ